MPVSGRFGALGERDFRLLWLGQATSALGSGLVPVALAFAVVQLTDSASALGIVLSAGLVSRVCLLLLGGVVADRLPRQRVMLAADAVRACTQGVVAVLLLTGRAEIWHLIVLFALYGAADSVFSPASTGLVPETVSPGRLQEANALMGMSRSAALVAGPVIAGLLVSGASPGWAFAIDALTFGCSCLSLSFLRLPGVGGVTHSSVLTDLRAGWREVRGRPWATTTIVRFSLSNLAMAPLFVLGPTVAHDSLGGATAWGLIGTAGGIGSVLGAGVALRVRPPRPLFAGTLAVALCALELALLARPFPAAVIALAAALGFGATSFSNALWFTALQERIPREALSRVSSYDWLGSLALQPVGYALAGPAAGAFGISATLVGAAAVQVTVSVGAAFTPAIRALGVGESPEPAATKSSRTALT